MCQKKLILLAICFSVRAVLCAVEPEEPIQAMVLITYTGRDDAVLCCNAYWDVTHVTVGEGEPLWKAMISLESAYDDKQRFTSQVLDDAVRALAKDIADDDRKKDSEKKYVHLQPGIGCLTQTNEWMWTLDIGMRHTRGPFSPGSVRLMLGDNTPDQRHLPEGSRPLRKAFEGFPSIGQS